MKNTELQKLTSLLFATRRLVRQRTAVHGAANPYTWLQMESLGFIEEHDGPAMQEIAAYLHITAPSASSLVNKLVKSGFVRRKAGADKRAVRLYASAKGKGELLRGRKAAAGALQGVFSVLPSRDMKELIRVLSRVAGEK